MLARKFALLILILSLSANLFSQEPQDHPKKVYKSPDGKLYINKELPLYLRVATSPEENAKSYLLTSEDSKDFTNPMFLDTEGYNSFHSPWKIDPETKEYVYPKEDIVFEIYADSKPPTTKTNFGTKTIKTNDKVLIGEKTSLKLSAHDATSGVENIYYSLDKQPFKKYNDPLPLEKEKEYLIKFYAADNVGNAEKPKEIKLILDLSRPKTSIKIEGDKHNNIISGRSEIVLTAKDELSDIKQTYYQIDNSKQKPYKYTIKGKYLSEGEHTLKYYSIDQVNNKEDTKEFSFYVDKTPPTIVEELIGNTFIANGKEYFSGRNKLKLISMDNKAGVKEIRYSINNSQFKPYEKPFYLSKSGDLNIQTLAIDKVNNKRKTQKLTDRSNVSYVDLSGPKLGHNFEGPEFVSKDTFFISKETKIELMGNDKESGFKKIDYKIQNGENKTYEEPFSLKEEGLYTITYTGYDNLGNTNTNEILCMVDNKGPEIFHRFSMVSENQKEIDGKKLSVYPPHVVLFLSSTDEYVGFDKMYYSINKGEKQLYHSLIEDFEPNTAYSINVTAYDKLSNKEKKKIEFYIE
jgi:hypothetical protein